MRTLVKLSGILAVAIFAAAQAQATVITNDTFSYADGDLPTVSGGIWTIHSGTPGVGDVQVTSGMAFTSGARSGDDNLAYGGTHSNDTVYAGFDAVVTAWSATQGIGYFAHFKDASTFNFFARTYVTNVAGSVSFGITGASTLQPPTFSTGVALGSTNRVVIAVDQTGAFVTGTLYLNGVLVGSNVSTNASGFNMTAFALRESNTGSQGTVGIDNLIIGTTFEDVAVVPEPSTVLLVGIGVVGLLAFRRRRS